ncbi:ABC-three component system protein [Bifidobacterium scaligerum]|uniref:ABC-three component systems C-terminal domain-containing protein n=1 Tax=Bifidobacterium scaligerum TaxID=2052656 RepID=A0A2M9HSX8_9BIFI|nr:ABC-three component system protein [Bifidobacterium scaligerum]PJM79898.1 hypothetical protein CUU80_01815 [Bifidobacterium scaligerum]
MAKETQFRKLIDRLRPLMKGTRNLGAFVMQLVDMGLKPAEGNQPERSAQTIRKESTWKSYANGTLSLSKPVASEIVGRWDSYRFEKNLLAVYDEEALNDLADSLHVIDPRINKGNVAQGIGSYFYDVFAAAAGHRRLAVSDLPAAIQKAESTGVPYFNQKTGRIHIGDDFRTTADKADDVPTDIQPKELTYVRALLRAYCEQCELHGKEPKTSDIPKKYREHFVDQRKAYFSAEWLRDQSRDCIDDGELAFRQFLEEIRQGVWETNLDDYPTQVKRLFETLKQSTNVQLSSIGLNQIEGLIDVWCRKGACHELVSEGRMSWEVNDE